MRYRLAMQPARSREIYPGIRLQEPGGGDPVVAQQSPRRRSIRHLSSSYSRCLMAMLVFVVAVAPMSVAMPVAIDPVAVFIPIAIMVTVGPRTRRYNTTR
jgi:hypothetical protein